MNPKTDISDIPWVVDSKLEPSHPRPDLVRRNRLLSKIHGGVNKKLVLVVAPAGYGKSSLLGQWAAEAAEQNVRFAWLTLEPDEADTKQFLAYVVLVLARTGLELDELLTGARDGFADAAVNNILLKLIRLLNASAEKIVLVLEDYHNAECDPVNEIVKRLIRDTNANFTLFIDSRRQPDLDAFSLIAAGDAIELGATELRLTKDETLLVVGDTADETGGLEIYDQTEGWPVAVQLALVRKRAQPSGSILTGVDGGLVASYLTEQIFSTLGPETQELLLTFAFLERFNAELTNFVLDRPDAWRLINSLTSFAALIVPLDSTGGWYRLHHLFAEYLRDLQERRDQEWIRMIRLRASQWYANEKLIVESVRYAAFARDYVECERLVLNHGGWKIILQEGISVLRNTLRLIPDDVIATSPRLMIARAYLHSKFGEIPEARALLDAATQIDGDGAQTQRDLDRLAVESMINLYEDREEWTPEHKRLRERYHGDPGCDPLAWGTMGCEEALLQLNKANYAQASEILRSAFSLMRQSGSVLGLNYCYVHAALIALHRGDLISAGANADRAGKMAEENFGSDSGLKAIASVVEHVLRIWRGDFSPEDWPKLIEPLFQSIEFDGWITEYITSLDAAHLMAEQCSNPAELYKIFGKLRWLLGRQKLPRLEFFLALCEYALAPAQARRLTAQDIIQFTTDCRANPQGHDLQSFFFASKLAGEGVLGAGQDQPLADAIALAEERGAMGWLVRLRLTRASGLLKNGSAGEGKAEVLAALNEAVPTHIRGPFLADKQVLRALSELRSDLRHNEDALMTLNFIDEILVRANKLNPTRDSSFLSEREYEVLVRLARGMSNKEIARSLELTENTVKFHLKSLFSKLSVSKRAHAVLEAERRGLID